jgi:hypothetical protein
MYYTKFQKDNFYVDHLILAKIKNHMILTMIITGNK